MIDHKAVHPGHGIDKHTVENCINYINGFHKVFINEMMDNVYNTIEKTKNLSKQQADLIQKVSDAISEKEIEQPSSYLIKYWKALIPSVFLLGVKDNCEDYKHLRVTSDKYEKIKSLYSFFINTQRLTPKQLKLLFAVFPNEIVKACKEDIQINYDRREYVFFFNILKNSLIKEAFKEAGKVILQEYKEKNVNEFIDLFLDLLVKDSFLNKASPQESGNKQIIKKIIPVPQEFLSLKKIREMLTFVG